MKRKRKKRIQHKHKLFISKEEGGRGDAEGHIRTVSFLHQQTLTSSTCSNSPDAALNTCAKLCSPRPRSRRHSRSLGRRPTFSTSPKADWILLLTHVSQIITDTPTKKHCMLDFRKFLKEDENPSFLPFCHLVNQHCGVDVS